MKLWTITTYSFIASMTTGIIGATLKIMHLPNSDLFLTTSLLLHLVFFGVAFYEVRSSKRIDFSEKTMWTIAFLFFPGIAGIIYFTLGRRRV